MMAQSPFPGMDPYLEAPGLWPDVHSSLIGIFREQLSPLLAPKYVAELDTQVIIDYIADDPPDTVIAIPDVAVTQAPGSSAKTVTATPTTAAPLRLVVPMAAPTRHISVYIRLRENEKLVAAIELLSPTNKRSGENRQKYLKKRMSYFETGIHLVEIDLLRKWPRMPLEGILPESAYLVMVSNAYERPVCDVWPIGLRQPLPVLSVPLLKPDPPVSLDIGQALRTAYERARYDLRIDYMASTSPPLSPTDAEWAATLPAESANIP